MGSGQEENGQGERAATVLLLPSGSAESVIRRGKVLRGVRLGPGPSRPDPERTKVTQSGLRNEAEGSFLGRALNARGPRKPVQRRWGVGGRGCGKEGRNRLG